MPEPPPPGTTATCDTAGILGGIVGVVASIQPIEAIKVLGGQRNAISRNLTVIDLWDNRIRQIGLDSLGQKGDCPTCTGRELPWLEGDRSSRTAVLCGRNSVQLRATQDAAVSLDLLAEKLDGIGNVVHNRFLLRLEVDKYQLTIFPDGRAIIGGTDDIAEARTVHSKYIGS